MRDNLGRPPRVVITSVGLCSSLGGAVQACAAARAGISRPSDVELTAFDRDKEDAVPITGHPVPGLTSFRGKGRLIGLAEQAITDLVLRTPGLQAATDIGFHLCLTDQERLRWPATAGEEEAGPAATRERLRT